MLFFVYYKYKILWSAKCPHFILGMAFCCIVTLRDNSYLQNVAGPKILLKKKTMASHRMEHSEKLPVQRISFCISLVEVEFHNDGTYNVLIVWFLILLFVHNPHCILSIYPRTGFICQKLQS